jgi:hypothetical protein
MSEPRPICDSPSAGWEESAMNTLRQGASLSLYQKLQWLEEIEEVFLCLQSPSARQDAAPFFQPLSVAEDKPTDPKGRSSG